MRSGARGLVLLAAVGCAKPAPPSQPQPVPPAERADTVAIPESPLLQPSPAPRLYAPVRLAFVGDINLGTETLPDGVPPDSGRGLLDRARPSLLGDLVVGNFEGVLADTGTSTKCLVPPGQDRSRKRRIKQGAPTPPPATRPNCYSFRTPTMLAPRLVEAGFTHMNLANNHANDLGPAGRESTEQVLEGLGIRLYGPLGRITVDTIRRGDGRTTVGLIGFTTYPYAYNLLDLERSAAVVDSMRPLVDLLLVTFHGGAEGVKALRTSEVAESLGREPRGDLRRWARAVIDAGADGVIGHGPHVLRGMEFYRDRLIAYSLGNFVTYRGFNLAGPLGITGVLQLEFADDRKLRAARFVPMKQLARQGPFPDADSAAVHLIRRLSAQDFGVTGAVITDLGEIVPPVHP